MATPRLNKRPVAALVAVGFCAALASCTPPEPTTRAPRPPDPGYDADRHLRAEYAAIPECLPRIEQPGFVATLMAEPANCPTSWFDPTLTPCTQIELPDGTRQSVPRGIVGIRAAGTPPRRVRLAWLSHDGPDHCLPTDVAPRAVIYLGQG